MKAVSIDFKTKVFTAFATTLLTGLLVGGMAFYTLRNTESTSSSQILAYARGVADAERLRYASERTVATARSYMLTGEQVHLGRIEQARINLDRIIKSLYRDKLSEEERTLLDEIRFNDSAYRAVVDGLISVRKHTQNVNAITLQFESSVTPKREALDQAISKFVRSEETQMAIGENRANSTNRRTERFVLIITSLSLCLAIALAFTLARTLMNLYAETERAYKLRDDLVSVVSHDLKNPIAAAILTVGMIQRKITTGGTPEQLSKLAVKIEEALHRSTALITGLLDLGKLEAGEFILEKNRVDMKRLIHESVSVIQPLIDAKHIVLSIALDEGLIAEGDYDRLTQIIWNLMGNAIKFNPEGGWIKLSIESFENEIKVCVRDNGPGILEVDLPYIFDRYWQAKQNVKKGSGLGLAISKGFVEAHGGKIWVESKIGFGSAFCFTIRKLLSEQTKINDHFIEGRA
jgi:signal transduction histidine kinase